MNKSAEYLLIIYLPYWIIKKKFVSLYFKLKITNYEEMFKLW